MKIGIDLSVLKQRRTGIGNYAFNLARALLSLKTGHEWVAFASRSVILNLIQDPDWIPDRVRNEKKIKIVELPEKKIPFWDAHVRNARIMREQKLDALHGVANTLPLFFSPLPNPPPQGEGKAVVTIHDLAIYKHPEWFARQTGLRRGEWLSKYVTVPRSIKKADRIIVPSEATKRDLKELFNFADSKIAVIAHGVEARFFRQSVIPATEPESRKDWIPGHLPDFAWTKSRRAGARDDKKGKYILFVGTIEPRKNVARLLEAYEGLPDSIKNEYELLIVGAKGWGPEPKGLKGSKGIEWVDYVSYENLPGLYQNATLFVYPSLYEGFGLPVLEAMAAGVPVITSRGTSAEEVAGEAGILVDPYSTGEIRAAMEKVLTEKRPMGVVGEKGVKRARDFTWEETARKTLKVYESLR